MNEKSGVEVTKFRKHEGWVGYQFSAPNHPNLQVSGKTWAEAEHSLHRSLSFHFPNGYEIKVIVEVK